MRRMPAGFLAAFLLLAMAACGSGGEEPTETDWTPLQMVCALRDSQESPPGMTELLPGDRVYEAYVTESYGLNGEEVADGAILAAGGASAQELAVLRLADGADPDRAAEALGAYLEGRIGAFTGYLPEEAALLEAGEVVVRGNYIALLVCGDTEAARAAFAACFTGEPPAQTAAVQQTPAVTTTPETTAAPATESWSYDEERLLSAWAAGDWSGLAAEDQAILDVCAQVLADLPADGSDYDRELAVHDWMLAWGSYDSNTLSSPPDFQENPNNDNPYGFLVDGRGICMGYASTFQLFMDLLGIECITVEDTAHGGTADHAWNQVYLDGAWYCVDVTWDDPTTGGRVSQRTAHRYFNVTSDFMRDTDHQWEESAVPEADGTVWGWG